MSKNRAKGFVKGKGCHRIWRFSSIFDMSVIKDLLEFVFIIYIYICIYIE